MTFRRGCGRSRFGLRAPSSISTAVRISFSSNLATMVWDGHAVFWGSLDDGHVAETDERHMEGARDGRGRHGEHVDVGAHLF